MGVGANVAVAVGVAVTGTGATHRYTVANVWPAPILDASNTRNATSPMATRPTGVLCLKCSETAGGRYAVISRMKKPNTDCSLLLRFPLGLRTSTSVVPRLSYVNGVRLACYRRTSRLTNASLHMTYATRNCGHPLLKRHNMSRLDSTMHFARPLSNLVIPPLHPLGNLLQGRALLVPSEVASLAPVLSPVSASEDSQRFIH